MCAARSLVRLITLAEVSLLSNNSRMKKILSAKIHGILDYAVVATLVAVPTLLHFSTVPACLAYALAVIHLIFSLSTDYAFSLFKVIPMKIHGWVELAVSIILLVIPWALGFSEENGPRAFFMCFGVILFTVWSNTDYKKT